MKKTISLLFILLFFGCAKDKTPNINCSACAGYDITQYQIDDTGVKFPAGHIQVGSWHSYFQATDDSIIDFAPAFNPRNSNEIVFVRKFYLGFPKLLDIVKMNIITKEQKVVFSGYIYTDVLNWSSSDWIFFEDYSTASIVKIKSNGDSLTYLTKNGDNSSPYLDDKNKLIYFNRSTNSLPRHLHVMDINGNNISEISTNMYCTGVAPSGKYLISKNLAYEGITIYDIENKTKKTISLIGSIACNRWFPDSKTIMASSFHGTVELMLINAETAEVRTVKTPCHDKEYTSFGISQDCKSVVYQCTVRDTIDNASTVKETYSLQQSDIYGKNFRSLRQ